MMEITDIDLQDMGLFQTGRGPYLFDDHAVDEGLTGGYCG
jgi:hypothetical protein